MSTEHRRTTLAQEVHALRVAVTELRVIMEERAKAEALAGIPKRVQSLELWRAIQIGAAVVSGGGSLYAIAAAMGAG